MSITVWNRNDPEGVKTGRAVFVCVLLMRGEE